MAKYINKLTDKEIEEFLIHNGYTLAKGLTDDNGLPIDSIERDEDSIFIRAKQLNYHNLNDELKTLLFQKTPQIKALSTLASMHSGYGRNIDIIFLSDYFMSKFCITEDDEKLSEQLCTKYIKFMVKKFPNYKADLIEYYNSLKEDDNCIESE